MENMTSSEYYVPYEEYITNVIRDKVKKMKRKLLDIELMRHKFHILNDEPYTGKLTFRQELIYDKINREIASSTKKQKVEKLVKLMFDNEMLLYNEMYKHVNDDGTVKMEDFIIKDGLAYIKN